MSKYITVSVGGIITSVATETGTEGYTKGLIECFLPTEEEMEIMGEKEIAKWIKENNIRMEAICKFLNENNL